MSAAEKAEKQPKEPKIEQNGVSRPTAGTKTARVWEIADAKSAELGRPAKRKEVLDICEAEGINVATGATQYGRWTKFHGIARAEAEPKAPKAPKEPKAPKAKKAKAAAAEPEVTVESGESTEPVVE